MSRLASTAANYAASAALGRSMELLKILDREHTTEELYTTLKGVRHEMSTLAELLPVPPPARRYSQSARAALRTQPGCHRHRMMEHLEHWRQQGRTNAHLAAHVPCSTGTARARTTEMHAAGWIEPLRRRYTEGSKRRQTVWVLTEEGSAALKKLKSGQMVLMDIPV